MHVDIYVHTPQTVYSKMSEGQNAENTVSFMLRNINVGSCWYVDNPFHAL